MSRVSLPIRSTRWFLLCALGLLLLLLPAAPIHAATATQRGTVKSGVLPVVSSKVTLYRSAKSSQSSLRELGTAKTDASGAFEISYNEPSNANVVLYLIAQGGTVNPSAHALKKEQKPIKLLTVLGKAPRPTEVVINERTTIASAFAMAQFLSGRLIAGKSPGLQNAAATVQNLANIETGDVGSVLGTSPNGTDTNTLPAFNTLANILAVCVRGPSACANLFALATTPQGKTPGNTLTAALNLAHFPGQNQQALFDYSQSLSPEPYQPGLNHAPDAWTLALKYVGNGREFDGPGNMAIDRQGNLWIANNYQYKSDPLKPTCGSRLVSKLTPTGSDFPGAPYRGGGVNGAGFGVTLDPGGNAWIANFGFYGTGCTNPPLGNSVSHFNSAGQPLSPPTGYTNGPISSPQGIVSDPSGNIWIANCGNDTITQYPGGDHTAARVFGNTGPYNRGISHPFDIAIDGQGYAWITSTGNSQVVALTPDGTPLPGSPFSGGGIYKPLGLAVDSLGNVWVANTGVELPCPQFEIPTKLGSVTLLNPDGSAAQNSPFTGGGITLPWDVAVDGNDNIWVANFAGKRLSQLCGARTENCPPGLKTGDPITPDTGYTSDGLDRNTGVVIDSSGNVWLANNWKEIPVQTNPGGDGIVEFIGLAAPVKTPLSGLPRKP